MRDIHRGTVPVLSTLSTSGSMAVAQLIVAGGYAIAARSAGPAAFGQSISAIAVGTTAAGLVDFGLAALQTRELASGRSPAPAVAARLVDRLLFAVTIAIVAIVATSQIAGSAVPFVISSATVMIGALVTQLSQVILRATGRAHTIAAATLCDKAVFAGTVVLLTLAGVDGAFVVVVGVAAGFAVDAAICASVTGRGRAVGLLRIVGSSRPRRWILGWRGVGGYGLAAGVVSLQQMDVPLMSLAGGAGVAGVYGAVSRWTTPLLLPAAAIAQVGIPHAAAAATARAALVSLRKVVWIIGVAALVSVMVALFAHPLTVLILGPDYGASSLVLQILALATIPTLLAQPLVMIVESRRRERSVALVLLVALATRLGCAFTLTPVIGGTAGAFGVLLQQALTCVLVALLALRLLRTEKVPV